MLVKVKVKSLNYWKAGGGGGGWGAEETYKKLHKELRCTGLQLGLET